MLIPKRTTLPLWLEVPVGLVAHLLYRVRSLGRDHVPASGGAVLVSNHLSYVDVVVLQMACPRPVRFLAFRGAGTSPLQLWILRRANAIEVVAGRTQWLRDAVDWTRGGGLLCVFAEGEISRTGQLMTLRPGYLSIARRAGVPVVPVAVDGLWGSVFSFSGNRYIWKRPRLSRTPVTVAFGAPLVAERRDTRSLRKALEQLGVAAFSERPGLAGNLGAATVAALAGRPGSVAVVDRTAGRRVIKAATLVAAAAVLGRRIRARVPEGRVGIVLPPGAGAAIANLAVVCAGKVPVNLNFTASRAAVGASIEQAGIRTVISAEALRARLPDFPWPERVWDLRGEMAAAGGTRALIPWMAAAWLLPRSWVASWACHPGARDQDEAALLFTSGSGGLPKGVVLSHRNLLANCTQISSLSILPNAGVMLGCLPVFHSFGFTFTMWYPLLRGCRLVTSPSPLDTRAVIDAVREEEVTIMLGAPTFLRPLLKKAQPRDLRSLDLLVTGAEKLPDSLRLSFLEKFQLRLLQGYGLTETSPVACLNQPDPPVTTATADPQVASRAGAVGRLLPGMAARLVDPETFGEVPAGAPGILLLRGANIFSRYLQDPAPGTALRDGWFVTWDLAQIDDDGFISIAGRLARFSKIGGEMVPHGTIELALSEALGRDPGDAQAVVVTGMADAAKGEQLVVVTTLDLAPTAIRDLLAAAQLPNLWIPRLVRRVDAIPLLGSGKLDLAACRRLAEEPQRDAGPAS